jgi:hypothetical protein
MYFMQSRVPQCVWQVMKQFKVWYEVPRQYKDNLNSKETLAAKKMKLAKTMQVECLPSPHHAQRALPH